MTHDWEKELAERQRTLADVHDEGATEAVRTAVMDNADVDCMAYCYGGRPVVDWTAALADLAESGWMLVRGGVAG